MEGSQMLLPNKTVTIPSLMDLFPPDIVPTGPYEAFLLSLSSDDSQCWMAKVSFELLL